MSNVWSQVHSSRPSALVMGNFDGVHIGHQHILAKLTRIAKQSGLQPIVLTFSPHPTTLLRPQTEVPLLSTDSEKTLLLKSHGVTPLSVLFSREFANLSAHHFVELLLRKNLGVEQMLIGPGQRFGKRALGTIETLQAHLGRERVHTLEPYLHEGDTVSSTKIRTLLLAGDLKTANRLMGRPFSYSGTVVPGDQRGKKLGYPTANLDVSPTKLRLPHGVYGGQAEIDSRSWPAVVNLGVSPTFEGTMTRIEAHLLDFDEDIYGQKMQLKLSLPLRKEKRFNSEAELSRQIEVDLETYRRLTTTLAEEQNE